MGRLMKDIKSGKLDQITAKAYLDKNVFDKLEQSLNHLLETIERNGEFEKYVEMLADKQERQQRDLRRRAREQKRVTLGDEYQSSDTEESGSGEENESYGEESYGDEVFTNMGASPFPIGESPSVAGNAQSRVNEDGTESVTHTIAAEQINMINDQFNPLRLIALHLKELNEVAKSGKK